jgi:undecaprenyl diphosphate synthase
MRWISRMLDRLYDYLLSRIIHIPATVAVTPNGNRRRAKRWRMSLEDSYKLGATIALMLIDLAEKAGVKELILFGLSYENQGRKPEELRALRAGGVDFCNECLIRGIQVHVFGEFDELKNDPDYKLLHGKLVALNAIKRDPKKITVHVAVHYSGKREVAAILRAVREHGIEKVEVDPMAFALSAGISDVDLSIRTGAKRERRTSGLLPFQMGYAELFFSHTFWGDFTRWHFLFALWWYSRQQRNFGK